MSAFTGTLSAIDRNHCPPSYGMPVRLHRNPQWGPRESFGRVVRKTSLADTFRADGFAHEE